MIEDVAADIQHGHGAREAGAEAVEGPGRDGRALALVGAEDAAAEALMDRQNVTTPHKGGVAQARRGSRDRIDGDLRGWGAARAARDGDKHRVRNPSVEGISLADDRRPELVAGPIAARPVRP